MEGTKRLLNNNQIPARTKRHRRFLHQGKPKIPLLDEL